MTKLKEGSFYTLLMLLVDFFPKDKVNLFFLKLVFSVWKWKAFCNIQVTKKKMKELSLYLFSPTPFPLHCDGHNLSGGQFYVRFSNSFCVLQFADLKSLS